MDCICLAQAVEIYATFVASHSAPPCHIMSNFYVILLKFRGSVHFNKKKSSQFDDLRSLMIPLPCYNHFFGFDLFSINN